jgi:hypothetical protein
MHGMWGSRGVAGHRVISAGTVLVVGGGLALYQMTSLVLGPGGSRQLNLSLAVPAVDTQERTESWSPSGMLTLGTLVAPAPSTRIWARPAVAHRASGTPAGYVTPTPVATPVPAATPVPVASPVPVPHPPAPPSPPIVRGGPDPQPGTQKPDDSD